MDKETTILIIAQNGLKTAAALFNAKSVKIEKLVAKATEKKEVTKLKRKLRKAKKLASILIAADEGITAYVRESIDDDV